MKRKLIAAGMLFLAALTVLAGCKNSSGKKNVKTFTAFVAVQGKRMPEHNRIRDKIAQKTGAQAEVEYLVGQSVAEKMNSMIKTGKYPDFLDGGSGTAQLLEAGAYVPLDEYLDDYPNIKNYLTEEQWNQMKQPDGHIYYLPQFGIIRGEDMNPEHSSEAFWIQKRVLIWAGYPKIRTVDQYFQLIEAYMEANPVNTDGSRNTGFQILCDDWRYFCLENPPQFLAGYPNDGCAVVDPETKKASVYDTIPEAKQYFQKLNEMYQKGVIEPDTFFLSYEQYLEKLSEGNVLGIVDQYWQFMDADNMLYGAGMTDRTYVPLGLVADESITDNYRCPEVINSGNGLGITVSCKDVEGALKFLNDLLEEDVQVMRWWGEEHVDYEIDENGYFYRTKEQRKHAADAKWQQSNLCSYYYFPHYEGLLKDGKNAADPEQQPEEYYATLDETDKKVLDAYGYEKWTDFLTPMKEIPPWFALYTAENSWPADTDYGKAKEDMREVKREWLPKVIMSDTYEETWEQYMQEYNKRVDIKAYEEELTREVERRIQLKSANEQIQSNK